MKRVPYETMVKEFKRVLVKKGFSEKRAKRRRKSLLRTAWRECIPTD